MTTRLAADHRVELAQPHRRRCPGDERVSHSAADRGAEQGDRSGAARAPHQGGRATDPALLVRAAAADALGKLRDPSTLADLERALQDPTNHYRGTSLWFRRHLVEAMGAIGTEAAAPYLARALEDADPEDRTSVV